jgi:hypothetical protein
VRAVVPVLVAAAVLAVTTPAIAGFQDSATATSAFTTAQLAAPTGLTATPGCAGLAAPKVTLGWTASSSTFATGYDIYRAVGGGASTLLTSVSPRTTVAYVDNAVSLVTTYHYIVKTRYAAWTAASAQANATTGAICL